PQPFTGVAGQGVHVVVRRRQVDPSVPDGGVVVYWTDRGMPDRATPSRGGSYGPDLAVGAGHHDQVVDPSQGRLDVAAQPYRPARLESRQHDPVGALPPATIGTDHADQHPVLAGRIVVQVDR